MDIVLLPKERFDKKSSMRRSNLKAFPDNAEIYSCLFSSGALDKSCKYPRIEVSGVRKS